MTTKTYFVVLVVETRIGDSTPAPRGAVIETTGEELPESRPSLRAARVAQFAPVELQSAG